MVPKNENLPFLPSQGRRKFLSTLAKGAGAAVFLPMPGARVAGSFPLSPPTWTVGQIMDLFIQEVPRGVIDNTVDTLKAGNRDIKVSGIVTSMFASLEVIRKAIELGANFIIAHEPTFYNHLDETDWLEQDEVYRYKADLLKKHQMAVWRNHDYVHSYFPDGVQKGVVTKLGWEKYQDPNSRNIITLPSTSLENLIQHTKQRLGITTVRYIGDLSQNCRKVLLMPGASGGRRQIQLISQLKPDVVMCGEISEWETAEYVRDARSKGQKLSLVVMGHVDSEEPGSEFMAAWLKEKIPGMEVVHVPSNNPLSFF